MENSNEKSGDLAFDAFDAVQFQVASGCEVNGTNRIKFGQISLTDTLESSG